jgi:hypothetical protein
MTGEPQASAARLMPAVRRRRWSAWIAEVKQRRKRAGEDRLEVLERMERLERTARRAGEYLPEVGGSPRWF